MDTQVWYRFQGACVKSFTRLRPRRSSLFPDKIHPRDAFHSTRGFWKIVQWLNFIPLGLFSLMPCSFLPKYCTSRNDLTTGVSRGENPSRLNPFPWARLWLRSSFPLSPPKEPSSLLPPSSPQSSATVGRPRTPHIPKCYSTPDMAEKGNLDFESYFVV